MPKAVLQLGLQVINSLVVISTGIAKFAVVASTEVWQVWVLSPTKALTPPAYGSQSTTTKHYYAHFGHNEFILCLRLGAHSVRDYHGLMPMVSCCGISDCITSRY